jgi:ATP-binding cassette, subfamily B, bacterial
MRRLAGALVGAAPWTAALCLVFSLTAAVASVSYSLGFRELIDGALAGDSGRVFLGAALVAVLFTLGWLLAVVSGTEGSLLTDRVSLALGERIARLVGTLPTLEHFERPELLARVEQVTENRRTLAGAPRQIIGLAGQALRAVVMIVLLATIYPPVLVVPAFALAPGLSDRWAGRVRSRADERLAEDRRLLGDLFGLATSASEARELRTLGMAEALAARHAELAERVRRRSVRAAVVSAVVEAAGWVVFAAAVIAAIVVLVLRAAHAHATPGDVVMAVTLLRRAQTQISRSTDTAGTFTTSLATARALVWLEDFARARRARGTAIPAARLALGIRVEGLTFAYGDEPVLGPLDLSLPAGATVALVGENGAGKTTLVKLLCGLHRPTAGRIVVDGVDLAELDAAAWRARIGAAFQDYVRFAFLLRESVGVGDLPRLEDSEAVHGALVRAGARGGLPLDTRIGGRYTGGRELSGGQWQRIALARGLMRPAPLLVVLDEPSASLDAPSEAALFDRYAAAARDAAAAQGTITLLVSHRFSTVRAADLIVVLERGRVCEIGGHEALLAADGVYAELFRLQARAYSA